jgi:ribosomal-protein-alanine N-acetyltransferase
MTIAVNPDIELTSFALHDLEAFVHYANDPAIYANTLNIPHPYTRADGQAFLAIARKTNVQNGIPTMYAIRQRDGGSCIGSVVRQLKTGIEGHADEIGFWLGRPFWGNGIMTACVRAFCAFWFAHSPLVRMSAISFTHNHASRRVLLKCGFRQEGYLRQYYCKDGAYLDGLLFAKLKPPFP